MTERPDFGYVCLRDGTRIRPRSVLTTEETGGGMVMVQEEEDVRTPEMVVVSDGECYV